MRICISGTFGVTSLVHRLVNNTFSLHHKPSYLTTIYRLNDFEVFDVPNLMHCPPIKCHILILTCSTQKDIFDIARKWFGLHKHLIVAIYNNDTERAALCPDSLFVRVDNMSREGIDKILQIIRTYKYHSKTTK